MPENSWFKHPIAHLKKKTQTVAFGVTSQTQFLYNAPP